MNPTLRKKLLWLHTWTGLTLGLAIVMLAVTGAILIAKPWLEDSVYRHLMVVPECSARLPLDELVQRAVAAHPRERVHSIAISAEADASAVVQFGNKDQVFLNPCSGQVLGEQNVYGGLFGTVDWLHRFRFMDNGRPVAGWITVAFLVVLTLGGIALWWPRRGQKLSAALKFDPRLPGVARTLSLHRAVGIYTALLIVLLAVTSIPIAFVPVRDWIYAMADYKPPVKPKSAKAAAGTPPLPMEAQWQTAQKTVPEQEWAELRFPPKPGDAVEVELRERDVPHEHAKTLLYLDANTGAQLGLRRYEKDMPLGRKIYLWFIALHAGVVRSLPYQALLLIAALGVPVQAYSGFSPWIRRQLRRPAAQALTVQVAAKTPLTPEITAFELVHPQGKDLPPFGAGAHIDVHVPGGPLRQYSLSSDPQDRRRYVIGVLRHADSRGGSIGMHTRLAVGDTLAISAPKNFFPLQAGASRTLLFAGGVGITPILAMARTLAREGRPFELHYCARSRERAAFVDEIEASAFADRTHFHFSDRLAGRPVDIERLLAQQPRDALIYVCGPEGFMDGVASAAQRLGWPAAQVRREHFAGQVKHLDSDVEFDVKLARSGKVLHIAKHRTVAAVLTEAGIHVPMSCEQGVCGTCLTRVLAGEPEHRDAFLSDADRAAKDRFTPCCSRACSPVLVLDL